MNRSERRRLTRAGAPPPPAALAVPGSYPGQCPCWHVVYSREARRERLVTDPDCSACGGTGWAEWIVFNEPRDAVVIERILVTRAELAGHAPLAA